MVYSIKGFLVSIPCCGSELEPAFGRVDVFTDAAGDVLSADVGTEADQGRRQVVACFHVPLQSSKRHRLHSLPHAGGHGIGAEVSSDGGWRFAMVSG